MLSTWEFAGIPNDNGVVHTAGGQPDIMGRPRHIHHICQRQKNLSPIIVFLYISIFLWQSYHQCGSSG